VDLVVESGLLETPRSFEAGALKAFHRGDWENSIRYCEQWSFDEAFSKRPATMGSYIATIALEDFALAERLARRGLEANPGDALLRNNLVVALVNRGAIDEARGIFSKIGRPGTERMLEATFTATDGLLHYRSGDRETGRQLYLSALSQIGSSDQKVRSLALIHLAREEFLSGESRASEDLRRAEAGVKGEWPEVQAMFGRLRLLLAGEKQKLTVGDRTPQSGVLEYVASRNVEVEEAFKKLRNGLGETDWLVDEAVSGPFGIEALFANGASGEEFAQRLATYENSLTVDVTDVVGLSPDSDVERLAFVGLYPSGAVRGVSARLYREANRVNLSLETPIALVDPESSFESVPVSGLLCLLTLVGFELPPYGG